MPFEIARLSVIMLKHVAVQCAATERPGRWTWIARAGME